MKKIPYPLNYFTNIWTPKKVFSGRKSLSGFQLILTFILLNALLLMPVSIGLRQSQGVNVVELMPHAFSVMNKELLSQISENNWEKGELKTTESNIYFEDQDHLIGRNLQASKTSKNQLILNKNSFTLSDQNGYQYTVNYTQDFSLAEVTSVKQFETIIQEQWFRQNRPFIVLTLIMMTGSVLFISNLMIVIVGALLLWLARKSQFSSIKTFKESLNLMINAMGIGTLLGFITGWLTSDVTIMVSIQSAGIVLMLVATFFVTRFREDYQMKSALKVGGVKHDKKTI